MSLSVTTVFLPSLHNLLHNKVCLAHGLLKMPFLKRKESISAAMKSKNLQITDFTLAYFITHLVCKLITGKCYLIKFIMLCGAVLLTDLIKNFSIYVIYYGMTIVNGAHKRYCWTNSCKGDEAEQNEGLCSQTCKAKKPEINGSCECLEQTVHLL